MKKIALVLIALVSLGACSLQEEVNPAATQDVGDVDRTEPDEINDIVWDTPNDSNQSDHH